MNINGHGKPIRITPAQIEKKLQVLCECGFKIVPQFSCEDILRICEKIDEDGLQGYDVLQGYSNSLEKDILMATIFLLGEDYKDYDINDYEYGRCYCENLLLTDFECYDGHETYMGVVERMVKITQGALKLDNMKSWYSEPESGEDGEDGRVWISFEFRGEKHEFSYESKEFFHDVGLFAPIIKLLEIANPTKIFAYYDFGEMYAIICIGKDDLEKLNKRWINFKPLGEKI